MFHISGPSTIDVSSEEDPEAEVVVLDLKPGDYSITLDSGWSLERVTDAGTETVDAQLLSDSSQSFTIKSRKTTKVSFRFQVAGEALAPGRLEISIDVNEAGAGGGPSEEGLKLHVTFDDAASIETPDVGPAGTLVGAPVFTSGKKGSALSMTAPGPETWAVVFPGNVISADRGTIEIWARLVDPDVVIPWHDAPYLFVASPYALGFNGNDGFYGGGLVSSAGNGAAVTGCYADTYTYSQILGGDAAVREWHHYALVYDVDGIPALGGAKAGVILDGVPAPTTSQPCGEMRIPTMFGAPREDLMIPYTQDSYAGHSVELDELKIWDYAKTTFE
jgi:hypothetical protein